ncbi:MAG: DUF218 domain-containing protein [Desulfobacteraceae bacterium]|nr:YdcF family protein [Desulfobacteraceae bacterium]MBC2754850.1 DUF218 domain-containing protein [Desulfobacteraceae bacterium]
MKVRSRYFCLVIVSLIIISAFTIKPDPVELLENSPLDSVIHPYLEEKLRLPPPPSLQSQFPKKRQIIYVMGGDEKSLQARFKKASLLFHAGIGEQIWVYIQPGITAFNQTLGRNFTNEEWARRQLALLNIAEKDIDFIDFEEGFWGTLSESRKVLEQAGQQGYAHIHVVTSTYHTRRVWLTFSCFSEKNNISFTVYAGDDVTYLRYLLKEYSKLLVYKYILLPLNGSSVTY